MYDYNKDSLTETLGRYQAIYEKFKGIYDALLFAQDEGVFELTLRSQTGAVVVPVSFGDGTEIAAMVVENFSARLDTAQANLNLQLEEIGLEVKDAREQKKGRELIFEQEAASRHAAYTAEQQAAQVAYEAEIIGRYEAAKAAKQAQKQEGGAAL